jgi:hypothetical protein
MGRRKSFVSTLIVEQAMKSHNCRFNHTHRIGRGEVRLTAREGRAKLRYCAACAVAFMEADIELLRSKIKELGGTAANSSAASNRTP